MKDRYLKSTKEIEKEISLIERRNREVKLLLMRSHRLLDPHVPGQNFARQLIKWLLKEIL